MLLSLSSACGGSGNESGSLDAIELSATAVSVGSTGNCVSTQGPVVHVHGGTPRYNIARPMPQSMPLSRNVLQFSGDSFAIPFKGICMDAVPMIVEDEAGLPAELIVSNGA